MPSQRFVGTTFGIGRAKAEGEIHFGSRSDQDLRVSGGRRSGLTRAPNLDRLMKVFQEALIRHRVGLWTGPGIAGTFCKSRLEPGFVIPRQERPHDAHLVPNRR